MRKILLSGVALAALAPSAPAIAQDASKTNDNGGIAQIVVTAQRKEESLQKAAIPIDAVTADSLQQQGIQVADDLSKAVPAIAIVNGGGTSSSVFLRGVGNITNNAYYDGAISTSYDGVVLGRSSGAFTSAFYDLARIEVLKGPQGILYGRNATGGAVNIIPNHPKLGQLGIGFNASYGNFNAYSADAYVNAPLGANTAIRIAGTKQKHDGYNRDGSDDLDRWGVRGQVLFEPTSNLSVRVAADYTKIGGIGSGGSYDGNFVAGNFVPSGLDSSEGLNTPAANAYRQSQIGAPGFGFLTAMNRQQSTDYEGWGVNAEVKLKTGIGEVTFIPAYRKGDYSNFFYGPAFNTALFAGHNKQYSAELRLAGSKGMLDYVVGGFYFNEKVGGLNQFNQEFVLPMQDFNASTESAAAFGQLTAHVSDRFRLVGGLRYTHDHKAIDGSITNYITSCGGLPPTTPPASFGVGCQLPGALPRYPNFTDPKTTYDWLLSNGWIPAIPYVDGQTQVFPITTGKGVILKSVAAPTDSGNFSKVTWKAGFEYDAGPQNLVYATVETGYRAGGFQLAEGYTSYRPETITAFTIGTKNRFLDNKLQFNLELFYWKYKDQQVTYFTVSPDGVLVNANQNVGRSDIQGFDVDVIAKPFRGTTLSGKVQYLDTKYTGLLLHTAPPRDNFNCPRSVSGTLNDGVTPVFEFDCSGKPALFSPPLSINLRADQQFLIGDKLDLTASVFTAWKDKQWGNFNYLPFQLIPAYWTTGATLTLHSTDGWSIQGYVNNIEGTRRVAFPQASPIGFAVSRYTAPRTYGIRISGDF